MAAETSQMVKAKCMAKFPMICTGVESGRFKVLKLVITFYQIVMAKVLARAGGRESLSKSVRSQTSFYFPPKMAKGQ
jgi:hypothetical protein